MSEISKEGFDWLLVKQMVSGLFHLRFCGDRKPRNFNFQFLKLKNLFHSLSLIAHE